MIGEGLIPVMLSISAGVAMLLLVAGVASMRSPARTVQGRVQALAEATSIYANDVSLLKTRRGFANLGYRLDRLVAAGTAETLERSGLPLRVGEYVAIRLAAILLGAVLGFGAGLLLGFSAVVGLGLGLLLGCVAPPVVVSVVTSRRAKAIERQLAEMSDLMASMMRSGFGYLQALSATASELDDPLASELTRLVDAIRLGADVDESLEQLNRRLNSADFDMVATAIAIQRRSGGNLAEILEGVSQTIRHRQAFRLELSALTSRERFSAVIIAFLPLALVAFLGLMDPVRYKLLFIDPRGQVLLGVSLALDLFGYIVIKKISKVEV
ncbi:MAG: type II secretion system F family protein [Dehalococcoidia bacterium]